MPKCENCKYLVNRSYEYQEYECMIFGDSDEFKGATQNGCRFSEKVLAKKYAEIENCENAYYESFNKFWEEQENTKVTCAICGIGTTGNNVTTCDSNHNFVSEPCGQTICYNCWEKQRKESIYNNKIPDCCLKAKEAKWNTN